jgi:serine/threonine protein kinase
VALKVSMTEANSSVISELELMMQMRPHPNVVQLFGFSIHPETDSIVLIIEYCNGGSLQAALESDEISSSQKRQWILGVANGLAHLHSHKIVHRDLAARNIMLSHNEPKLTDFGMSRLVEEQNLHGTTKSELGPIKWMAPESLRNKEYSTKSGKTGFFRS